MSDTYDMAQRAMLAMRNAETDQQYATASTDLYTAFMALDRGLKSGALPVPTAWTAGITRSVGWLPTMDG